MTYVAKRTARTPRLSLLGAVLAWLTLSVGLAGCLHDPANGQSRSPVIVATPAFAAAPPTADMVEAWIGPVEEVTTDRPATFYRVWGGSARQLGAWLSPTPPTSGAVVRASMALPPQNTAEFWCVVVVPAGTRMRTGVAAPAFDQPGGGRQVELLQLIPAESFGPPQPLAP